MKVIVVGAGVAGLSIGWRLRQAGADVVILERAQPASGATWAAAGMVSVFGDNEQVNPAEMTLARRGAELWPDFAAEIEDLSGRPIGYRRDGKLVVATTPEEYARFAVVAAGASGSSMISAAEACAFESMLRTDIAGAWFDPSEAHVDNRALGVALVQTYLRAGGVLQINETVLRLEVCGRRVVGARTPFALYEGDAYVLAAGAWTSRIEGLPVDALPPVVPVKGEMIALRGGSPPKRVVWGNGVYLVSRHDHLLVGATATHSGFDTSLTDEAKTWLAGSARALMPVLAQWDVVEHWAGLRPGSPDDLPILGRTALDGLFVASGQFRNGILFAPAIADIVSRLVTGTPPGMDIADFDPRRFSRAMLAKGDPLG